MEDTLEEMGITIGEEESDDEDDHDDELIDDADRQLIDRALCEQSTTSDICTDSRQELDSDFLAALTQFSYKMFFLYLTYCIYI